MRDRPKNVPAAQAATMAAATAALVPEPQVEAATFFERGFLTIVVFAASVPRFALRVRFVEPSFNILIKTVMKTHEKNEGCGWLTRPPLTDVDVPQATAKLHLKVHPLVGRIMSLTLEPIRQHKMANFVPLLTNSVPRAILLL
jgi:hypothetical protein